MVGGGGIGSREGSIRDLDLILQGQSVSENREKLEEISGKRSGGEFGRDVDPSDSSGTRGGEEWGREILGLSFCRRVFILVAERGIQTQKWEGKLTWATACIR